jgi:hypothetical protein
VLMLVEPAFTSVGSGRTITPASGRLSVIGSTAMTPTGVTPSSKPAAKSQWYPVRLTRLIV